MKVAELLTANGADLGRADKFGHSPLHYAAHLGNKEIVILLITNSADVNAKCKGGETPLSMASNKKLPTSSANTVANTEHLLPP